MSIHLHTTISAKADKILDELAKTYGTKSRVLEQALETFLRVEEVGSCDDCAVKTKVVEQSKLRETLDLTSVSKKTLNGLLEVAIGDKGFEDFLEEQRVEARNVVAVLKDSIGWKTPTSFKDFLLLIEEVKNLTRLFDVASHNEIDNTVVLRTKVFAKIPEIVASQVAMILEGTNTPFDLRIMGDDIVIKMVRIDVFSLKKKEFDKVLAQQIQKRLDVMKPSLFRNNLVLVGPGFLHWAEKYLEDPVTDMGAIVGDVRTILGSNELPKEPEDFVNGLVSASIKMNWFKQAKVLREEEKKLVTIVFQATSQAIAKIAVSALSVMLATRGWKLTGYSVEHVNGSITVEFVGTEDQSLLDQMVEPSAYRTIGKQFLDAIPVPRDVFNSFASQVFETDRKKFDDIYRNAGARVANAIRMLARNDSEKAQRLAENFILKNLNALQNDAEVRFVDKEQFSVIFKRIDPLLMNSQRLLVESVFKELGYDVSTTAFQNLLSFKLKHVRKPFLEPIPRKVIMQSDVVDAMSANSAEEAFSLAKDQLDEMFPKDYPWTIREVGERLMDMYRVLDIEVEIEYFEGGFTLKYKTCPYYKLVKSGQKKWLCNFRKQTIDYIIDRVTQGRKSKIKIIKSLLQNEHPCEYAVFLTGFLEKEETAL
jgi:hypothetical protein